jgi:hypothetical protein
VISSSFPKLPRYLFRCHRTPSALLDYHGVTPPELPWRFSDVSLAFLVLLLQTHPDNHDRTPRTLKWKTCVDRCLLSCDTGLKNFLEIFAEERPLRFSFVYTTSLLFNLLFFSFRKGLPMLLHYRRFTSRKFI